MRKLLILGLLLVGGIAVFLLTRKTEPQPPYWQEGARQVYELKVDADCVLERSAFFAGAGQQNLHQIVTGKLNMRIFRVTPQAVTVGFMLSPVQITVNGAVQQPHVTTFSTMVLATFTPEGNLQELTLPNSLSDEERILLRGFYQNFHSTVFSNKDAWEVTETDAHGDYRARYTWTEPGKTLARTKEKYLPSQKTHGWTGKQKASRVEVKEATATLGFAPSVSWLNTLTTQESLREMSYQNTKQAYASIKASLQMKYLPGELTSGGLEIWETKETPDALAAAWKLLKKRRYSPWRQHNMALAREALRDSKLEDFTKVLLDPTADPATKADAVRKIAEYLRLFPEKCALIPGMLKGTEEFTSHDARLIQALQMAGHREAQLALISILQNATQSMNNRLRSAVALGMNKTSPEVETIDALQTQWEARGAGLGQESLGNTCGLALGCIADYARASNPEAAQSVQTWITNELSTAAESGNVADLKQALAIAGNAGGDSISAAITPYLDSSNAEIRKRAAASLRNNTDAASGEALADHYSSENDANVRMAYAKAMMDRPLSLSAVETLGQSLTTESDAAVRVLTATALCRQADTFPQVKNYIATCLASETNAEVIQAVMEYYKPSDFPVIGTGK